MPPNLALAGAALVNVDGAVRECSKAARGLHTFGNALAKLVEDVKVETDADRWSQNQHEEEELEQHEHVGSHARFSIARLLAPNSLSARCCGAHRSALVGGGNGATGMPHLRTA